MPNFTSPHTLGDFLKHEYSRDYCREVVSLAPSADGYAIGSVLGKNTSTGQYSLSPTTTITESVTDETGAQIALAVLLQDIPANESATEAVIIARGPVIVADSSLLLASDVDTDTEKQTKYAQLASVGIVVREQV